jgi:dephospho-CoA kinase
MKRILITGMSGTGKSTVVQELLALGHRAVDLDDAAWSTYASDGEWIWREDRVQALLTAQGNEPLFVSGCASNQAKFYALFDRIVLLTAPAGVIVERLASRTSNSFGKGPGELDRVLDDVAHTEPLIRRTATDVIDAVAPLDDVVAAVLRVAAA